MIQPMPRSGRNSQNRAMRVFTAVVAEGGRWIGVKVSNALARAAW